MPSSHGGGTHRTYHAAEDVDGSVAVGCSCGWIDWVLVADRSWVEALEAIYAVRDAHEAENEPDAG